MVSQFITQRLAEVGIHSVTLQEFDAVQLNHPDAYTTLTVEGQPDVLLPLLPLRPNVVVPPMLSESIKGPMVYLGRGELADYLGRSVDGAVVVMDYDCGENWQRVFSRGAAAVIFLGDGNEIAGASKHAPVPINLPRFYSAASGPDTVIDPRVDRDLVSLTQGRLPQFEPKVTGRNIIGFIAGTDPNGEALVASANYDTFGTVPTLTPGTRGAANVAGLLQLAAALHTNPPKRDVWLLFEDAGTQRHRGARMFYDAVTMDRQTHDRLTAEHRDETEQLAAVRDELKALREAVEAKQAGGVLIGANLRDQLRERGDWMRADLDRQRQLLRRSGVQNIADELAAMEAVVASWDRVRRFLHLGETLSTLDPADYLTFQQLILRTRQDLTQRFIELTAARGRDAQRDDLRKVLSRGGESSGGQMPRVILHVDMNLSDSGPTWSAVAGDWSHRLYGLRDPASEADAPGYHTRILATLDAIAQRDSAGRFAKLDRGPLRDLAVAASFVPGRFVVAGTVAGGYGIPHVALMTGHDARVRDGQPSDTPANFDFENFTSQMDEAVALVVAASSEPALSVSAGFTPKIETKRSGWDGQRATGSLVTRRVTGGLSEDRPAGGAVVAVWPGVTNDRDAGWRALAAAGQGLPGYQAIDLVPVNAHGRFDLIGTRADIDGDVVTFAFDTNEQGQLDHVPTQATLTQRLGSAMRIDLFSGKGYGFTWWPGGQDGDPAVTVMRATSDAAYRPNLSLVGQGGRQRFWVLADRAAEPGAKVFASGGAGIVALGIDAETDDAAGVALDRFAHPAAWAGQTAGDLWRLNEGRLSALRTRGVTSPDLEVLHAEAGRLLGDVETGAAAGNSSGANASPVVGGEAESVSEGLRAAPDRQAGRPPHFKTNSSHSKANSDSENALRSAALSQRVYPALRTTMDDLVYAIVVLLLLTIPFSFAMERLLVGAAGVYGRIAGFVGVFAVTFGILYATHPGFAVASTPVMIFLAFAIVLLSCMVIWVLVRRFQTELASMQGRPPGVDAGGSRGIGAAVSMGMSTMRRRPTRTTLTAITVVMLTFTVLCFASVRREIGVRSVGLGPVTEAMPSRAVMVRQLDAGALGLGVLDTLPGGVGDESEAWIETWWRIAGADDDRPITVARVDDGRSVRLGGVLGVEPRMLGVWSAWEEALVMKDLQWDGRRGGLRSAPANQQGEEASASGETTGETPIPPQHAADALREGEVFLPRDVLERLELEPGDAVLMDGHRLTLAGATDATALARLRQVDGESWLPVDASAQKASRGNASPSAGGSGAVTGGRLIRLTPGQTAVASNAVVMRLGGDLHGLTRWVGDGVEPRELAEQLAAVVDTPVWVSGSSGAQRLTLGNITRVSGVWRLVAPILLGGLIIFGTLLGSISDRQKEIYTFSALGLGPKHVGMLFFAEAAVYAVVGGLGGQLLAQVVALGASWLAEWGWIRPVSINFASTQALFAIGVVMLTVMVSAIYPAIRASKSANPGLARAWVMPAPEEVPRDNELNMMFPFTVSAYDLTGVVAFLAEHFRQHADAGLGPFAADHVAVDRDSEGRLRLSAEVALAPFDLGVTQNLTLTGVASDIPGVDEVAVHLDRQSGTRGDWVRANRVFIKRLRRQFLVWRTLPADAVENYRMRTLEKLGENPIGNKTKDLAADERR